MRESVLWIWLPIKRQADNFSGKMMNYDAVCHTASTLFDLVSNNPSLISEKERDWFSMIQEQLVKIDATSARGRFLLQMFINHSFDPKLMETIEKTRQKTSTLLENSWITKRDGDLKFLWKDSTHIDLQQVGWKGMWIFLAQEIFWNSLVIQTHYISWVMVQEWLYNIPEFSENLRLLENSSTIEMAIELWRWLIKRINKSDMPEYLRENLDDQFINQENLIFRSSALTEDVEDIWSAPGIYESLKARNSWLDIEIAFKGVIASFFSEKAIIFRTKLGLCHTPLMTVLVQPFSQWAHWSLFATESWIELDISTSNVNTLNEETTSISFDYENNRFKDKIHKDLFQIGKKSFQIFGSVDMEFVIEDEKITILQLRMLNQPNDNNINNGKDGKISQEIFIENINQIIKIKPTENTNIHLKFSSAIDFNKFQEMLSIHIIRLSKCIHTISLPVRIAPTSHFSNIIRTLWIQILLPERNSEPLPVI